MYGYLTKLLMLPRWEGQPGLVDIWFCNHYIPVLICNNYNRLYNYLTHPWIPTDEGASLERSPDHEAKQLVRKIRRQVRLLNRKWAELNQGCSQWQAVLDEVSEVRFMLIKCLMFYLFRYWYIDNPFIGLPELMFCLKKGARSYVLSQNVNWPIRRMNLSCIAGYVDMLCLM